MIQRRIMNITMVQLFSQLKYLCISVALVILIWMFFHLFFRSIGGPFPYRTRGPFAKKEYYQLSEFPEWENVLKIEGSNKTTAELLIEGDPNNPVPPVTFGKPGEEGLPKVEHPLKK